MSIKTEQFMKLYKIMQNHVRQFVSFFFTGNRVVFGRQSNMVGLFCKKCWQLKVVNYLGKKITNQKYVLQKKKEEDWAFEVCLLTRESSHFLILVDWIIENDLCQILSVVLKFFVKLRGFGLFFAADCHAQTQ